MANACIHSSAARSQHPFSFRQLRCVACRLAADSFPDGGVRVRMAGTRPKPAGAPKPRRSQAATVAGSPVATRDLLAQREAELALIGAIQHGITAKLGFQS